MTATSSRFGNKTIFLLVVLLTLVLSGCGGGGGAGTGGGSVTDVGTDTSSETDTTGETDTDGGDGTGGGTDNTGETDTDGGDGTRGGTDNSGGTDTDGGDGTGGTNNDAPTSPCISTSQGCLTATEYQIRVRANEQTFEEDDGFKNQWGLDTVKADVAWARIRLHRGTNTKPGSGITLGAIDSGIDSGHPVFSGKTVTESFLSGASDEDGSVRSHGTSIASIMVANPTQQFVTQTTGARGVAWGADITMFALPTGIATGNYVPISLIGLNSVQTIWASNINTAIGWSSGGRSLDFVNVSLGFRGLIDIYSKSELDSNFGQVVSALKQSGSSSKTVFVWAAGNSHGAACDPNDFPTAHQNLCQSGTFNAKSPEILAGLPARFSELRANHIAVVAIDRSGSIAGYSNRCGIAANWCIAAPGSEIRVAYYGPINSMNAQRGSGTTSGTSFAAPIVTGGLALMKHFFRSQLSNTALVSRLYATADKSGIYKDSSIYGQGLMDLDAATKPLGVANLTKGNQVSDPGIALDDTSLNLGTAFGDGLTHSFTGQEIVAFDELGAPFWYSLDSIVGNSPTPSIRSRLTNFMNTTSNPREFGIFQPALGARSTQISALSSNQTSFGIMESPYLVDDGGHLSLLGQALVVNHPVSNKLGFSLFSNEGGIDQAKISGMEFLARASKKPVSFRSGIVSERQSLLRSTATGAFGQMSGNSVYAGIEGNWQVGSWHLGAGAEVGTVVADIDEGLLSVKSPMTTSAFALRAGTKLKNSSTLTFTLSQPVRIESGRAAYSIPVGRTIEGRVLKASRSTKLEPSGRQLDLSAQWRHSLSGPAYGDFRLMTGLSFQPGHNAAANPELAVLAGWRFGY